MKKNSKVGIGIIGLGWPGIQHTKAIAQVKGARLAAASDLNPERRETYRAQFSTSKLYHGYEDLLENPDVDAVVISLPNFLHFPATIAALQAGKHVLCEKPPTLNVAEIEAVRDEARARRLTYAFGRQRRFDPAMLEARRVVEEGRLGHVYYAKTQWLRVRGIPLGVGGWFTDKARSGGGAIIDIGIHALDGAWYLAGCPKLLTVTAQTGAYFANTVPEGTHFDVDDSGFAFLRFEGGLAIQLDVTWAMNVIDHRAQLAHAKKHRSRKASIYEDASALQTILYGDAATLQVNPPTLFSVDPDDGKTLLRTPLLPEGRGAKGASDSSAPTTDFTLQMADFVRAVRTNTPPVNRIDHAVELMKMLEGIYRSGVEQREVHFTNDKLN